MSQQCNHTDPKRCPICTPKPPLSPSDIHPEMYETRHSAKLIFGEDWRGPDKFEHGVQTLVAHYAAQDEEGLRCTVFCRACPAEFYEVVAYLIDGVEVYRIRMSSGMAQTAHDLATQISNGDIVIVARDLQLR